MRKLFFCTKTSVTPHAFVVADHAGGRICKSFLKTISAAKKLNGKVSVGVFGDAAQSVASQAASVPGVSLVIWSRGEESSVADSFAKKIAFLAKKINATHIVGSTASGSKDALPRVGALLDSQPISDVIEIVSDSVFKRPMYAGNVIATVKSSDEVKVLTVRPTAFEAAMVGDGNAAPIEEELEETIIPLAKVESEETKNDDDDKPDLGSAKIVISGGRGLKSKENFDSLLNPLCHKLHAALGASRAAVDAGFAPNEIQIGQTGKVVAPDLYIAAGISGAIQHVAGMKDSRTIVAINKDKDAAIFQIADYGLVGDLFNIIPEITKKI